jgi:hypothetical protein
MKKLVTICAVCVCVLLTTAAWGTYTTNIDENGNGTFDDGSGNLITLLHMPNQCRYYIPFDSLVQGDLVIYEPGTTTISDVLRFSNNLAQPGTGLLSVYSAREVGEQPPYDLADVATMPTLGSNVFYMDEQGFENGWNGVTYTPVSGQPGYITSGQTVTYNFTSDVPEPATIALLGLGALGLLRKRS